MIKISLILLVGLIASALLRRRSAAVRHWVLAATLACAAATPILERIVPAWQLPLSVSRLGRSAPIPLIMPIVGYQSLGSTPTPASPSGPIDRAAALQWMWLAGVLVNLAVLAAGLGRLTWFAAQARAVEPGPWTDLVERLARDYGLGRRIQLLQSEDPALLGTWGVRQSTIILPRDARQWPADRIRSVLGHELAHVQRHDWLVQMAAELVRSVYWFNPLAWMACRRLQQESEQACDDVVLSLGVESEEYAAHLLEVARHFTGYHATMFPAPAMARPSSLERRVTAMLNRRLSRTPLTRTSGLAIVLALVALTVPIAGLVASAQSNSAALTGTLVDAVGRILPDVELVLSNGTTKYSGRSDAAGHFSVGGLPGGDYRLEVGLPGFDRSQGRVTLGAGQSVNRDVALQIGGIVETVLVSSGEAPSPPRKGQAPSYDPATDRCAQAAVGGCIMPPTRISDARPRYPQAHKAAGVEGKVEVDGRIGTDGFIKDIRVMATADPEFASAAAEALREWQFTPTRLGGVPVEASIHVVVNFVR